MGGKHGIFLLTAPRNTPYLDRTLASLDLAGLAAWDGPLTMIADGYSPDAPGWDVQASATQEGVVSAFFRLLRVAIASGCATVTVMQDDIVLARNAVKYMRYWVEKPPAPLISWWTLGIEPPAACSTDRPFFAQVPQRLFGNGVCITVEREHLIRAFASGVPGWTHPAPELLFARTDPEKPCAIHYPNIVDHIGDVSTMGRRPLRRSRWFVGETFDCAVWL